jgi:hypothetical protein
MARALDLDLEPGVVKALALATAAEEESARAGAWALEKDPEWVKGLETVQGQVQAPHSEQVELRWAQKLDGRRTLLPEAFLKVRMQIGLRSAWLPVPAAPPEGEKKS